MAPTVDLTPAPGRFPIPLERNWTAVVLQPVPGVPVAFVALFHHGALEVVVDEPEDAADYVSVLVPISADRLSWLPASSAACCGPQAARR